MCINYFFNNDFWSHKYLRVAVTLQNNLVLAVAPPPVAIYRSLLCKTYLPLFSDPHGIAVVVEGEKRSSYSRPQVIVILKQYKIHINTKTQNDSVCVCVCFMCASIGVYACICIYTYISDTIVSIHPSGKKSMFHLAKFFTLSKLIFEKHRMERKCLPNHCLAT